MDDDNKDESKTPSPGISSKISQAIGNQFYRLGVFIALRPWTTVIVSLLFVVFCSLGFFRFRLETDPLELWVPKYSSFLDTTKWIANHIGNGYRPQQVLIVAPNVLEPKVLEKLAKIHWKLVQTKAKYDDNLNITWNDVCVKMPFITGATELKENRKKRFYRRSLGDKTKPDKDVSFKTDEFDSMFDTIDNLRAEETPKRQFNPSVDLNPSIYCKFINNLPYGCFERSILELWEYDVDRISKLSLSDVLDALENITISPVSGHETNFTELLGNIKRDEKTGRIISAEALHTLMLLNLNYTEANEGDYGNLAGTEKWLTKRTGIWEDAFLKEMEELSRILSDNETKIYYSAARSFGDVSHDAMFQELDKLAAGIILMTLYVQCVLSKFSWTEFRMTLGSVGLLTIVLAFICACGVCSLLGISYGPVHTSLPFLLMGLGVDDLFVMMACWRRVQYEKNSVEERMGSMLRHAGAAITVTSLTDIIAFLVGSLTVIPSLQSFCLYAAIGIFITYAFAVTLFVAIFTLDEYRIQANRNAFVPCIVHKRPVKEIFQLNIMRRSLKVIYSKCILTTPGKVFVILLTLGITGFNTAHIIKLEQRFDMAWFVPEGTYLHDFIYKLREYFPEIGYKGAIFMGRLNYTHSLADIDNLVDDLDVNAEYFRDVASWIRPYSKFVNTYYSKDILKDSLTDYEWRYYLSKFLFSPDGGIFQPNFRFDKPLKCGEPTPNVTVAWFEFNFRRFKSRDEEIFAMHKVEDLIVYNNITKSGDGFGAPWSIIFSSWTTNEIIDREVIKNISLALVCVMFCTFVVIIDLQTCFWIFVCVLLTLINVGGLMQIWGLTIDLTSCIGLQLAIGLCVDYAAHIGHTFLFMSNGSKTKRALDTVLHIGSAVLYGGGSTISALLLLSGSKSYSLQSFFKIFFLVITFGLYHGVVLLPVILSLIGPSPFLSRTEAMKDACLSEEEMQPINSPKKNSKTIDNLTNK